MNTKCSIFTSVSMLAHSFLIESSSKLLVTRTGIKARRFDRGTLDSGVQSLPFGLLVYPFHRSEKRYVRLDLSALVKIEKTLVWYTRNNLNIFFVIACPCMVSTLLRPQSIVRYFNRVWITRSAVFTRLWCFRMLNVDKMKHWNSSRVQKNEIVFKLDGKHH